MSGLDTRFIPLGQIQEQFWDKLTDAPMARGTIEFFSDLAHTVPKNVYVISGTAPEYTYTSIGSTITLSSIGTLDDGSGNNIAPYLFPYDSDPADPTGEIELYYIVVTNSDDQFQFSISGVPSIAASVPPSSSGALVNFIPNAQFSLHNDLGLSGTIVATDTEIAYGDWHYVRSTNSGYDHVTFPRFNAPISNPTGNPRYAVRLQAVALGVDTYKAIEIRFADVNRFSDPEQQFTFFFSGISNAIGTYTTVDVKTFKYFGSGGSASITSGILGSAILDNTYGSSSTTFGFGSNIGQTIGANNDDYCSIRVVLHAPNAVTDISLTDFVLYLGNAPITTFPFEPSPVSFGDGWLTDSAIVYSPISLSNTDINPQPIPGAVLTLDPGKYLINYSCSGYIVYSQGNTRYDVQAGILDTSTMIINTDCTTCMFAGTGIGTIAGGATLGGGSANSVILTLTVPTTIQVYAALYVAAYVTNFYVRSVSIIATRLASVG